MDEEQAVAKFTSRLLSILDYNFGLNETKTTRIKKPINIFQRAQHRLVRMINDYDTIYDYSSKTAIQLQHYMQQNIYWW